MPTRCITSPQSGLPKFWRSAVLGSLLLTAAVQAQVSPAPGAANPPDNNISNSAGLAHNDQTVVLTPFEVKTNGDTSYGALNTNSLTSFNVELNKLPITDDIMTRQFIDDVGATTIDALISTYSVGGGLSAVSTDGGATTQVGDRQLSNSGNGGPTTRGLTGGGTRVNGFQKGGGGQLFDTERAEVIQGPQGLLYGAGGAGGVINVTLNRAKFDDNSGQMKYQLDEYGTKIATLDYNVGTNKVAVRIDLEDGVNKYNRLFIGGDVYGLYGQLAVSLGSKSVVRFSYENVDNRNTRNSVLTLNAPATPANGFPTADPRNTLPLTVLLAEGQAGNLDNGHVNYGTAYSFQGDDAFERILTQDYQLSVDTQVFPWLSTQLAGMWDQWYSDTFSAFQSAGLTPPGYGLNNTGQWAIAMDPSEAVQLNRREAVRFSAVADFKFLHDHAHNQSLFGVDYWSNFNDEQAYNYYQADSSGNILENPALVNVNTNPLGRTTASTPWYIAVPNGPIEQPEGILPFQDRFSNPVTGVNYVKANTSYIGTAPATPTNPSGYTGPGGVWDQHSHAGGVYFADFLDWFDGKLTTLGGIRYEDERVERRAPVQNPPELIINNHPISANVGLNFELFSWLRPYVSYSSSSNLPNVLSPDPVGNAPAAPSGHAEEAGLKFSTANGRISGALSVFNGINKNDQYQIQNAILAAINPTGGNGSVQPSAVWATVDRKSQGVTLELTAQPIDNWRSRLALSDIQSTSETTRVYNQVYNDQFYTNAQGGVLYADGTPYLVPSIPGNASSPQIQLTTALLNGTDPTNKNYVAVLDPDSGLITNRTTVFPVAASPVHGSPFTGVTGLPISAIQLNWGDPNGHNGSIPIVYSGERSPNYSQYQITWTNTYNFTTGWLKGLGVGGTYLGRFKNIAYYYDSITLNSAGKVASTARLPFWLPTINTISPMVSYRYKFGRFQWVTQLNINNALNAFHWVNFPNPTSGAYNYAAIYSQQPRSFVWSNTLRF